MAMIGAISGWLLTWLLIFGYCFLGRVVMQKITGKSAGKPVTTGATLGFFAGILLLGRYMPEETSVWTESYFQVLVFFFTDMRGILVLVGGFAGWLAVLFRNDSKG